MKISQVLSFKSKCVLNQKKKRKVNILKEYNKKDFITVKITNRILIWYCSFCFIWSSFHCLCHHFYGSELDWSEINRWGGQVRCGGETGTKEATLRSRRQYEMNKGLGYLCSKFCLCQSLIVGLLYKILKVTLSLSVKCNNNISLTGLL